MPMNRLNTTLTLPTIYTKGNEKGAYASITLQLTRVPLTGDDVISAEKLGAHTQKLQTASDRNTIPTCKHSTVLF